MLNPLSERQRTGQRFKQQVPAPRGIESFCWQDEHYGDLTLAQLLKEQHQHHLNTKN